jgi:hypothetical protein
MTTTDAAGPSPREFLSGLRVVFWDGSGDVQVHRRLRIGDRGADQIIAALESAGYEIRQRAGVVEISVEDVLALRLELMSPRVVRRNATVLHRLERAIARATGDGG